MKKYTCIILFLFCFIGCNGCKKQIENKVWKMKYNPFIKKVIKIEYELHKNMGFFLDVIEPESQDEEKFQLCYKSFLKIEKSYLAIKDEFSKIPIDPSEAYKQVKQVFCSDGSKKNTYSYLKKLYEEEIEKQNEEEIPIEKEREEEEKVTKFEKDFLELLKEYKSHNAGKTLGITEGKDIVVVIGGTGAGKSTLLNLLVGHDLQPYNGGYIVKKNNLNLFAIGHRWESVTTFPQYIKGQDGIIYVDLPGLNDSRGDEKIFLNAIIFHDVLTKAKSVKFLFVATKYKITDSFSQLLKILTNFLPNTQCLQKFSLLVVTKADRGYHRKIFLESKNKKELELYKIFAGNKINKQGIPFFSPSCFAEVRKLYIEEIADSDSEQETIYDIEKLNQYQKKLREKLREKINKLESIQVPQVNISAFLNETIFYALQKICQNKIWTWSKYKNHDVNSSKFKEFKDSLNATDLFQAINMYDPNLLDKVYKKMY